MKRRCEFLDNFPGYNYNQGRGPDGGDTRQLGSTLMKAMLKEVPQFCDPSTKEDWSMQAHQQVLIVLLELTGSFCTIVDL